MAAGRMRGGAACTDRSSAAHKHRARVRRGSGGREFGFIRFRVANGYSKGDVRVGPSAGGGRRPSPFPGGGEKVAAGRMRGAATCAAARNPSPRPSPLLRGRARDKSAAATCSGRPFVPRAPDGDCKSPARVGRGCPQRAARRFGHAPGALGQRRPIRVKRFGRNPPCAPSSFAWVTCTGLLGAQEFIV